MTSTMVGTPDNPNEDFINWAVQFEARIERILVKLDRMLVEHPDRA